MSRSIGQNKYRRHRRTELRRMELQQMMQVFASLTEPLRRGILGRFKWLLLGR